jgi:hypothetical protein
MHSVQQNINILPFLQSENRHRLVFLRPSARSFVPATGKECVAALPVRVYDEQKNLMVLATR